MLKGLKATAEVSFLLESLVRTISRGMPGFTKAAFMYSVPTSIPSKADTASKMVEKKKTTQRKTERSENSCLILGEMLWASESPKSGSKLPAKSPSFKKKGGKLPWQLFFYVEIFICAYKVGWVGGEGGVYAGPRVRISGDDDYCNL